MKKTVTIPRPWAVAQGAVLAWLLTSGTAGAQPVIITQPVNCAARLGDTARFGVLASSPTPRTCQWQHDGVVLTDATNVSLTVSNVSLSDLGSYTVLLRNDAGETWSQPAWLKLARWTEFLYFGHSAGMMQYINGKTWFEYLADMLGIPAANRRNYAQGGASSAMMRSQILTYLSSHSPDTNTLVSFWKYFSDVVTPTPAQVVSNQVALVRLLADAGATQFLIPTSPNPQHYPPLVPLISAEKMLEIDLLLDAALAELAESRQLTFYRPDLRAFEEAVWANPGAYGFTNLTERADACVPQCDASQYYFWDGGHPTTAANRLQALEMYCDLVPPLIVSAMPETTEHGLRIQWRGGSPPFRLERCDDLAGGVWQADNLTFETSVIVTFPGPSGFFRLLYLGQ